MITEAIYGVFSNVAAFLLGLLPSWSRPEWAQTLIDGVSDGASKIAALGAWVPLGHIAICAAFLLTVSALHYGLRFGRMTLSVFTGGGGSAA